MAWSGVTAKLRNASLTRGWRNVKHSHTDKSALSEYSLSHHRRINFENSQLFSNTYIGSDTEQHNDSSTSVYVRKKISCPYPIWNIYPSELDLFLISFTCTYHSKILCFSFFVNIMNYRITLASTLTFKYSCDSFTRVLQYFP